MILCLSLQSHKETYPTMHSLRVITVLFLSKHSRTNGVHYGGAIWWQKHIVDNVLEIEEEWASGRLDFSFDVTLVLPCFITSYELFESFWIVTVFNVNIHTDHAWNASFFNDPTHCASLILRLNCAYSTYE